MAPNSVDGEYGAMVAMSQMGLFRFMDDNCHDPNHYDHEDTNDCNDDDNDRDGSQSSSPTESEFDGDTGPRAAQSVWATFVTTTATIQTMPPKQSKLSANRSVAAVLVVVIAVVVSALSIAQESSTKLPIAQESFTKLPMLIPMPIPTPIPTRLLLSEAALREIELSILPACRCAAEIAEREAARAARGSIEYAWYFVLESISTPPPLESCIGINERAVPEVCESLAQLRSGKIVSIEALVG